MSFISPNTAQITFRYTGPGGINRSLQSKLTDIVSVFGTLMIQSVTLLPDD